LDVDRTPAAGLVGECPRIEKPRQPAAFISNLLGGAAGIFLHAKNIAFCHVCSILLSMISKAEYFDQRMPWRVVESILPAQDKKIYDAWIGRGHVPGIEAGQKTGGRGKARKYSLANCVALATLWDLNRAGYKPSACTRIVEFMVERGEKIAKLPADIADEDPMLLFHVKESGQQDTIVRGLVADRAAIAAFIANPGTPKARPIERTVQQITGVANGHVPGFFFYEGGELIQRVLREYRDVRDSRNN